MYFRVNILYKVFRFKKLKWCKYSLKLAEFSGGDPVIMGRCIPRTPAIFFEFPTSAFPFAILYLTLLTLQKYPYSSKCQQILIGKTKLKQRRSIFIHLETSLD